jgi:hypothetical protein
LQGFTVRDSVFYLSGNNSTGNLGTALVIKGKLNATGIRKWDTLMYTAPFPLSGTEHGMSSIVIDSSGKYILAANGARTHFGEVQNNNGTWPGAREIPLSSRIFKLPIDSTKIFLLNDSVLIQASPYLFLEGIRNPYKMAWSSTGNLFAIDNSGDRDDPEELNWLRQGKHFGFPWRMGGHYNPLMSSPYNASTDPLVNPANFAYISGWFADDPNFSAITSGAVFTDPVNNFGPDADFYRDTITGDVKNASDEGISISSFSSHRSPLGLVFDTDSLLGGVFQGKGFVMSYMPGGDSSGYTPLAPWGGPCVFVDPSRDLLMLNLTYNAITDNFDMNAYRIAEGFYLAVDAVLVNNELYVIENSSSGDLWKLTFPLAASVDEIKTKNVSVLPNPASNTITFGNLNAHTSKLTITDACGRFIGNFQVSAHGDQFVVSLEGIAAGLYFYNVVDGSERSSGKFIIQR